MTPSDIMPAWPTSGHRDGVATTQMTRLPAPFADANWYCALTLKERLAALRAATQPGSTPDTPPMERRQQSWRAQPPFANPAIWAAWLAADGMTDAEFEHLVNEPIECVRDRVPEPPIWLTDLATAFSHPSASAPLPLPERFCTHPIAGLLHPTQPLLCQGLERLLALLAGIEVVMAACVLGKGAGGWLHVGLLMGWLGVAGSLGWLTVHQRSDWTTARLTMTHALVERLVGHRTRLAQESLECWHVAEDQGLAAYATASHRLDRTSAWLAAFRAAPPRGAGSTNAWSRRLAPAGRGRTAIP